MDRKPSILHLLMTRFREMKGSVDFERVPLYEGMYGIDKGKRQGNGRRI